MMNMISKIVVFLCCLLLLPACWGLEEAPPPAQNIVPQPSFAASSPTGSYLAARFALGQNDLKKAEEFLSHALEDKAPVEFLSQQLLLLKIQNNEIEEAGLLIPQVMVENSDFVFARILESVLAMRQNRLDDVVKILTPVETSHPDVISAPLLMAWAETGLGQSFEATNHLKQMPPIESLQLLRFYHNGLIEALQKNNDLAKIAFDQILTRGWPVSAHFVQKMALFFHAAGEESKTAQLLNSLDQQAETRGFGDYYRQLFAQTTAPAVIATPAEGAAEALFNVASLLNRPSMQEYALTYARLALYLDPDHSLAKILTAELLHNFGQSDEALQMLASIGTDNVYHFVASMKRGEILGENDPANAKSVQIFEQLAASFPTREEPFLQLGDMMRRAEKYQTAASYYSEALKRIGTPDERHWQIFYARGICYDKIDQWDLAEQDLQTSLELSPDQPYVLNYLGYSWVDRHINLAGGEELIARAVALAPNDGFIIDSHGWALYKQHKFLEAVRYLERAVEIVPQDAVVNDHLGDAYWRAGREKEARYQWQRVLDLHPDEDLRGTLLQKIESGLEDLPPMTVTPASDLSDGPDVPPADYPVDYPTEE